MKPWPILYSNLLYKIGQVILDIHYLVPKLSFVVAETDIAPSETINLKLKKIKETGRKIEKERKRVRAEENEKSSMQHVEGNIK